ncbi:hypothetical protein [Halomonas sp. CKK8]|nr:hypothetical protein [Halomonas sp. CKK8]WFM72948.1 hypothetical protein P8934_08120 [Halomonas sp. CKK8]
MTRPRVIQRCRDLLAGACLVALVGAWALVTIHQHWREHHRRG